MQDEATSVDKAIAELWHRHTFSKDGRNFVILLLLREGDWRPLKAQWWKKKEACVIGADPDGNFYLRVCDGTVRYWDHKLQTDEVLAPSVREFISRIS